MTNKLEEFKQKKLALQKEISNEAKSVFKEESAFLFKDNPLLKSFGWRQYTPYFMDGDTCVFSAQTDDPLINGLDPYNDGGDEVAEEDKLDDKTREKLEKGVVKFLSQFDEDMLKDMFGDHCEVIVSEKEVVVEEYEHE